MNSKRYWWRELPSTNPSRTTLINSRLNPNSIKTATKNSKPCYQGSKSSSRIRPLSSRGRTRAVSKRLIFWTRGWRKETQAIASSRVSRRGNWSTYTTRLRRWKSRWRGRECSKRLVWSINRYLIWTLRSRRWWTLCPATIACRWSRSVFVCSVATFIAANAKEATSPIVDNAKRRGLFQMTRS